MSSWLRGLIIAYDRVYRWVHGLNQPKSLVGPAVRLKLARSRRTIWLTDGCLVRRGDLIGLIHLNNDRLMALHADGLRPEAIGVEFRRLFTSSLTELARLTDSGEPLAEVRAFTATTILHHGLRRVGFEASSGGSARSALVTTYQRALLASLHPAGRTRLDAGSRHRAQQLWISRDTLRARFRHPQRPAAARRRSRPTEA